MTSVYDHLVTTLVDRFDVPAGTVRPDTTYDDLGFDSLAVVELFVTLQEEWGVAIDENRADGALTVEETARIVETLRSAA